MSPGEWQAWGIYGGWRRDNGGNRWQAALQFHCALECSDEKTAGMILDGLVGTSPSELVTAIRRERPEMPTFVFLILPSKCMPQRPVRKTNKGSQ
jgi:hypothetical protein